MKVYFLVMNSKRCTLRDREFAICVNSNQQLAIEAKVIKLTTKGTICLFNFENIGLKNSSNS